MKKSERYIQYGVTAGAWFIIGLFVFLFFFICHEGLPVGEATDWLTFLFSQTWNPLGNPPELGIFPMICGSLYVSLLAVLLAVPVGTGCALFLSFFVSDRIRDILLAFIDMLAGVPSVIFGFIGLTVVVNRIGRIFELASGESILAAAIVLAVMLLP
ncbi:MAG: phosphate ABC transporter permease subunit PstC, partial [Megasphaera micronuciformis]|nr:phosphate ABC transporter permease subunit PstC [Megasphaera micronuciformis]